MSETRRSAGDTFKKALHLAQENLGFLFVTYGTLFLISALLGLIPMVGTLFSQFLSTVISLAVFLQLRKLLIGESKKLEPLVMLKTIQNSATAMKVVTYLLGCALFFLPVAILFGILYTMGAFTGSPQAPTLNPSMVVWVMLGSLISLLYILFFVLPSILFALDLNVVTGISLKDGFSKSLTTIYANFWYITKLMFFQLSIVLIGGIFYSVLTAVFKNNSSQVLVLNLGSYLLLLIPTFIVLGCVRAALYCAFFDTITPPYPPTA
jgi:hypothetical protein